MKRILAVVAVLLTSATFADDDKFLPDGGSIVTSTDGGSTVTVDLGEPRPAFIMAVRCEGDQLARYLLCATDTVTVAGGQATHSCVATKADSPIDHDRTFDMGVNQLTGLAKRYLSFTTDDAGVPFCKVWIVR